MNTVKDDHKRNVRGAAASTLAAILLGLACAGAPATSGPPGPAGPSPADASVVDRNAERVLRDARNAYEAGEFADAKSMADSLVTAYPGSRWLAPALLLAARASVELNRYEGALSHLERYLELFRASDPGRVPGLVEVASVLYVQGRPLEAADSLLATPARLGDERQAAAALARRVASELGIGELEALIARWPSDHPLRPVFEVERASLLLAAGERERASQVARLALELDPEDAERERAERITSGEEETREWSPVIGAVLPLSGPLAPYGRLAEEGIRLAIEEYNRRHADSVTLIVHDDRDDFRRSGDLVRELERQGAVAVVGPLRTEGLEEAARRRRDRDFLIVSPTAPDNITFKRNVYTLWSATERVASNARSLGEFAVRDLQLYRFGVLYPSTPEGRTQLAAFADAVRARGGEITATVAYDDTATTFQDPLRFLGEARPQAIFAPASAPRTVIQLAPQFSFYGLRGVQVLGDADWSAPEVLRLVEPRFIDGTVVATFLDRSSPSVRWPEFVERYERTYRKGLQNSLVPALAYDATSLILSALPWGYPRRSAVARSFGETRGLPGATGIFYVQDGTLQRRPFVLFIKERGLVPAYRELDRGAVGSAPGGR